MTILDNVQMTSSTTGTGTLQLTATQAGYQSFTSAGAANNSVYSYGIVDTLNTWEVGQGTYVSNTSGQYLQRTIINYSSNSGGPINASGFATIYSNMLQQDYDTFKPANSVTIAANTALNLGSAVNNAANGYSWLPNGILLQWMFITTSNTSTQFFAYPVPFPTSTLSVSVNSDNNYAGISVPVSTATNSSGMSIATNSASHVNVYAWAIGH